MFGMLIAFNIFFQLGYVTLAGLIAISTKSFVDLKLVTPLNPSLIESVGNFGVYFLSGQNL